MRFGNDVLLKIAIANIYDEMVLMKIFKTISS